MAQVSYYGTGRRKSSIARVRLVPGDGKVTINNRTMEEYFGLKTLELIVRQPLVLTEKNDKYDVIASVKGGGTVILDNVKSGQSININGTTKTISGGTLK